MAPRTHPGTCGELTEAFAASSGRSRGKNDKNAIPTHPKTYCESHSNPYSPASVDPGFLEIGLVQLSQSVKTTNVTHTYTDRLVSFQADEINNSTWYAPRCEEAFLPYRETTASLKLTAWSQNQKLDRCPTVAIEQQKE